MHVDFFLLREQMLMERYLGKQCAGIGHQAGQVFVFAPRQKQLAAIRKVQAAFGAIEDPSVAVVRVVGPRAIGDLLESNPSPECIDSQEQFAKIDGLEEIMIGARFQRRNSALSTSPGSYDDNAKVAVLTQMSQGREAIFPGETKINEHNICGRNGALTIKFLGAGGAPCWVIFAAERKQQIGTQVFVVFDDRYIG